VASGPGAPIASIASSVVESHALRLFASGLAGLGRIRLTTTAIAVASRAPLRICGMRFGPGKSVAILPREATLLQTEAAGRERCGPHQLSRAPGTGAQEVGCQAKIRSGTSGSVASPPGWHAGSSFDAASCRLPAAGGKISRNPLLVPLESRKPLITGLDLYSARHTCWDWWGYAGRMHRKSRPSGEWWNASRKNQRCSIFLVTALSSVCPAVGLFPQRRIVPGKCATPPAQIR
jgi:hypothetical protein